VKPQFPAVEEDKMAKSPIEYFRIPVQSGAEFQVGNDVTFPAPGMFHEGFELGLVTHGRARFICEGRRFYATAGDLAFIPRGEALRVSVAYGGACRFSVAHVPGRSEPSPCSADYTTTIGEPLDAADRISSQHAQQVVEESTWKKLTATAAPKHGSGD
jgi:hypothetical protein